MMRMDYGDYRGKYLHSDRWLSTPLRVAQPALPDGPCSFTTSVHPCREALNTARGLLPSKLQMGDSRLRWEPGDRADDLAVSGPRGASHRESDLAPRVAFKTVEAPTRGQDVPYAQLQTSAAGRHVKVRLPRSTAGATAGEAQRYGFKGAVHTGASVRTQGDDGGADDGASCDACAGQTRGASGIDDIHSQSDAYYKASWRDHAQLFQRGTWVGNNPNFRRNDFRDGSYLTTQAHVPVRTYSPDSDASVVAYAAAVAALSVFGLLSPILAVAIEAVGVAGIHSYLKRRPYDAARQGYTVTYYEAGSTTPWSWYRYYGWRQSGRVFDEVEVGGQKDPDKYPNFADVYGDCTWHRWITLSPTAERPVAQADDAVTQQSLCASQLVQAMAAAGGTSGGGSAMHWPMDADISRATASATRIPSTPADRMPPA